MAKNEAGPPIWWWWRGGVFQRGRGGGRDGMCLCTADVEVVLSGMTQGVSLLSAGGNLC